MSSSSLFPFYEWFESIFLFWWLFTFYIIQKNVSSPARTLSINHPKMGLLPYLNNRISGTTRQVDFQWDEPEHLQPWFEIISLWRCFASHLLKWLFGNLNEYKLQKIAHSRAHPTQFYQRHPTMFFCNQKSSKEEIYQRIKKNSVHS